MIHKEASNTKGKMGNIILQKTNLISVSQVATKRIEDEIKISGYHSFKMCNSK